MTEQDTYDALINPYYDLEHEWQSRLNDLFKKKIAIEMTPSLFTTETCEISIEIDQTYKFNQRIGIRDIEYSDNVFEMIAHELTDILMRT